MPRNHVSITFSQHEQTSLARFSSISYNATKNMTLPPNLEHLKPETVLAHLKSLPIFKASCARPPVLGLQVFFQSMIYICQQQRVATNTKYTGGSKITRFFYTRQCHQAKKNETGKREPNKPIMGMEYLKITKKPMMGRISQFWGQISSNSE